MFEDFFINQNQIPINAANGQYDLMYVLLSFFIASLAAFTAISILKQVNLKNKRSLFRGRLIGSLVMGTGIWSMHFTGMLAYRLDMSHSYEPILTALSFIVAVAFSWMVFANITREKLSFIRVGLSAPLMGLGVALMHYMGMEAMEMEGVIRYVPEIFLISLAIAIIASAAAMFIMRYVVSAKKNQTVFHFLASVIMGFAVCGMHYSGMEAAVFIPDAYCKFDGNEDRFILSILVICFSFMIVAISIILLTRKFVEDDEQAKGGLRWHYVYYLLAGFNLVTALLAVIVSDEVIEINQNSINAKWFSVNQQVIGITSSVANLSEPSSSLFESNSRKLEALKYKKLKEKIDEEISIVRGEVVKIITDYSATDKVLNLSKNVVADLDDASKYLDEITLIVNRLFDRYTVKSKVDLERDWYAIQHEFIWLAKELNQTTAKITKIEALLEVDQEAQVENLKIAEYLILGCVLILVVSATLYGRVIAARVRKDEAALKESEMRFRVVADSIPNLLWLSDEKGTCTFFNKTWLQYTGRSLEEEVVGGWMQNIHPEDLGDVREVYNAAIERQRIFQVTYRMRRYDDDYSWMMNVGVPRKSEEGVFEGFSGSCMDVSDQRRAIESLQGERRFFQDVMDAIASPIFVKNKDHQWIGGNQSFWDMMGGNAEDFLYRDDTILFPKEEVEKFWEKDDVVTSEFKVDTSEEVITKADGETITSMTIKSPLTLADGNVGLVGIVNDITDVRNYEKELEDHRDNLEQMIHEQTKDLMMQKEVAEKASAAKTDFLANMSHELRTPINSVLGMSKLLAKQSYDESTDEMVETINIASNNLLEIINDILDLSKIEADGVDLEKIPFMLSEELVKVFNPLAPMASSKGIVLKKDYDIDDSIVVIGDPTRFRRVLTNLVGNAIKYTNKGSVTLKIVTDIKDDVLDLTFEVIDTGIGVAPENIDKIFEKFNQADNSITRKFGGTGLGLSITKELLNLMGGDVEVTSEVGKGSVFTANIPFKIGDIKDLSYKVVYDNDFSIESAIPSEEVNILIAEDHLLNQALMKKLLPSIGINNFTIVDDGLKAVEEDSRGGYDLILMDCHMPNMSGYAASKEIREREEGTHKHIPIIAMTANAMIGEEQNCLDAGMDSYISKPLDHDLFHSILSRWIKFSDSEEEAKEGKGGASDGVLDLSVLAPYTSGDIELEKEFIGIFVEQTKEQLEQLAEQFTDGENVEWKEVAHKMKGGAAMVGALEMNKLASQAQEMFDSSSDARQDIFSDIKAAFKAVLKELQNKELIDGES